LLQGEAVPLRANTAAPVDQFIPWLLDEDRQLRGLFFSEVIGCYRQEGYPVRS
jgi:hypothetical protein